MESDNQYDRNAIAVYASVGRHSRTPQAKEKTSPYFRACLVELCYFVRCIFNNRYFGHKTAYGFYNVIKSFCHFIGKNGFTAF